MAVDVGTTTVATYEVKRLDSDYFIDKDILKKLENSQTVILDEKQLRKSKKTLFHHQKQMLCFHREWQIIKKEEYK